MIEFIKEYHLFFLLILIFILVLWSIIVYFQYKKTYQWIKNKHKLLNRLIRKEKSKL